MILSSLPGILKWMGLLNSRQKCLPNWLIYRDCKFRSEVSTIIKAKQVNQKMFRQLLYRTFSLNMPPLRERERELSYLEFVLKRQTVFTQFAHHQVSWAQLHRWTPGGRVFGTDKPPRAVSYIFVCCFCIC